MREARVGAETASLGGWRSYRAWHGGREGTGPSSVARFWTEACMGGEQLRQRDVGWAHVGEVSGDHDGVVDRCMQVEAFGLG